MFRLRLLALLGMLVLMDLSPARAGGVPQVGKWERHLVSLANGSYSGNPFELEVDATFTHTSTATELTLPGYYAGSDSWNIGFMPTLVGEWTYVTSSSDPQLNGQTGSIDAVSSGRSGLLRADPTHSKKWKYVDGGHAVPVGVFIQIMHGAGSTAQFESLADFLQANSIHLINFRLCEQDICFSDVVNLQMDLTLWDRLEERLGILSERGIGIDLMLYTDDAGSPSYGGQSATEQFLIRYLIARLASFPVVLINSGIDINEYRDAAWHDWYGNFVKSLDPYGHPVSSRGSGDFSRMSSAVRTYNSAGVRNSTFSNMLNSFNGADEPSMNNDNFGEDKPPGINSHTPEDIRRAAWKGIVAGGVGFHVRHDGTNNDCANGVPANCDSPFTVTGIMSQLDSEQWLALVDPFIQSELGATFADMVPDSSLVTNGRALADPARTKILYHLMGVSDSWDSGNGGDITLRLSSLGGTYFARWFDPRTGDWIGAGSLAGGSDHVLSPPSTDDWVLLLTSDLLIFEDGFESGDTSAWDLVVGG